MTGVEITNKTYLRPREKARRGGVQALSDGELVQLILGSGTVGFSVARISRKIVKVLKDVGGHVSREQLESLSGVGPAKAAQILATFELASRYPIARSQDSFKTLQAVGAYLRSQSAGLGGLTVLTLDGSRTLLEKRFVTTASARECLREITTAAIRDKAAYIICARQRDDDDLLPTMSDLVIAKDLRSLSRLLGITSVEYLLYGPATIASIMKEAGHAA
jgi:DNA repair protein RadC